MRVFGHERCAKCMAVTDILRSYMVLLTNTLITASRQIRAAIFSLTP